MTTFSPKSANLDTFPLLKVKNRGKLFHNILAHQGKNIFFGRIITYAKCKVPSYMVCSNLGATNLYKIQERRWKFVVSCLYPIIRSCLEKLKKKLGWLNRKSTCQIFGKFRAIKLLHNKLQIKVVATVNFKFSCSQSTHTLWVRWQNCKLWTYSI